MQSNCLSVLCGEGTLRGSAGWFGIFENVMNGWRETPFPPFQEPINRSDGIPIIETLVPPPPSRIRWIGDFDN